MESLLVSFPFQDVEPALVEDFAKRLISQPAEEATHSGRREAFYAGRAALAFAFKYLDLKAYVKSAQPYGYLEVIDKEGRPLSGVYCNVTHTEKMALAAVFPAPVGVDVERLDRSVSQVVRRILSAEEKEALDQGNPELERQGIRSDLALWCAKEAYTKALGLGLGAGLEQIIIGIEQQPPLPVLSGVLGPLALESPLIDLHTQQGYLVSVCSEALQITRGFKKLVFHMD